MKKTVQAKIDQVRALAKTSTKGKAMDVAALGRRQRTSDSLSHLVRNEKEASVFLEELNFVIRVSNKK